MSVLLIAGLPAGDQLRTKLVTPCKNTKRILVNIRAYYYGPVHSNKTLQPSLFVKEYTELLRSARQGQSIAYCQMTRKTNYISAQLTKLLGKAGALIILCLHRNRTVCSGITLSTCKNIILLMRFNVER